MLISVSRLDAANFRAEFGGGYCSIRTPDGIEIGHVPALRGLYSIGNGLTRGHRANTAVQKLTLAQAHRVFGHINHRAVRDAIRFGLVSGIELDDDADDEFCDACAQAKPHRKPFPKKAKN
jgi:hypothetical protein